VLNNNDIGSGLKESPNGARCVQTLLDVEVAGGLVEHVDVRLLDHTDGDGKALKLTPREVSNLTGLHIGEVEVKNDAVSVLLLVLVGHDFSNNTLDSLRDVINILGLDDSLEVVFQNLGEVVLELGATEVAENFLPVRGVLEKHK